MGSSEVNKPVKEEKPVKDPQAPASQEQASPATGSAAADWTGYQAYSPIPPQGFLASSPQAHPYMWGVQQFIPPYGTQPHPYVAMYPHGGVYAHPTMAPGSYPFSPFPMPSPNGIAEAPGNPPGNMQVDGKSAEGKQKLPIKRSKESSGSLNMITGKNNTPGKTSGASAHSKSAESASDGSSGGSDSHSQNESQAKSEDRPDSEPYQNGTSSYNGHDGGPNPPHPLVNHTMPVAGAVSGVPCPATNLNIGMDYWGAAPSSGIPSTRGMVSDAPVAGGFIANGSGEIVQPHLLQDERELKRQRRKQSNRESARRSRLRKQAECDELAQRVETLKEENASLRADVARIRSDYENLLAHNAFLKERLGEPPDQEDPRGNRDDPRTGNETHLAET